MSLIIPPKYKLKLLPETTEMAIKMLKDAFQERLSKTLNLRRVTAPLFVLSGTGLNDDLNGSERAVSFPIADMGGRQAEVAHTKSLTIFIRCMSINGIGRRRLHGRIVMSNTLKRP